MDMTIVCCGQEQRSLTLLKLYDCACHVRMAAASAVGVHRVHPLPLMPPACSPLATGRGLDITPHVKCVCRYVDYAMDVPMYFVYRDGKYVNALGQSWKDFMAGKLPALPGEGHSSAA